MIYIYVFMTMITSLWIKDTQSVNWLKYNEIIQLCIKLWSWSDWKIPKTKLAKLCYLADFWRFYYHLESLTWLSYLKLPQWPVPEAYFRTIEWLEDSWIIQEEDVVLSDNRQAKMIHNTNSDINIQELTQEEQDFIAKICDKWKSANTEAIVEFTHSQLPRKLCYDMEVIPYEFITQEDPDHVY